MIDAYGGFVRCGNCNYKFNIHDQVLLNEGQIDLQNIGIRPNKQKDEALKGQSSSAASRATRIEPKLEQDEEEEELNLRFRQDEYPGELEDQNVATPFDSSDESRLREPQIEVKGESLESETQDDFQFPENLDDPDKPMDDEFSASFEELTEQFLEEDSETAESEEGRDYSAHGSDPGEPVLFESLDDGPYEEDSSALTLISDEAEADQAEPGFFRVLLSMLQRAALFLFWLAVAIALAYLLLGQIKDKLYPAYKNHSLLQKVRSGVCDYLPCEDARYEIDLFEIVVSRMDEVTAPSRQLHISIFLLNKAEYAQVYPNILLTLKTIDGSTTGQRVIHPAEYFTSYDSLISSQAFDSPKARPLVKPNKLGKILIKLDKPPADAVGFEARVVK
jgi:hypothetical protein